MNYHDRMVLKQKLDAIEFQLRSHSCGNPYPHQPYVIESPKDLLLPLLIALIVGSISLCSAILKENARPPIIHTGHSLLISNHHTVLEADAYVDARNPSTDKLKHITFTCLNGRKGSTPGLDRTVAVIMRDVVLAECVK